MKNNKGFTITELLVIVAIMLSVLGIAIYGYSKTPKYSEKGIKNLTYQWEGEEAQVIESTEEKQEKLSVTIDVKRGTNKINITATDDEGETQIKNEIIQGIFAPELIVLTLTSTLPTSEDTSIL